MAKEFACSNEQVHDCVEKCHCHCKEVMELLDKATELLSECCDHCCKVKPELANDDKEFPFDTF